MTVNLPKMHRAQGAVAKSDTRFRVLCCGRRWGKSLLALIICLYEARKNNCNIWYVAPTYKMVSPHWRLLLRIIPRAIVRDINKTDRRIELVNGSVIEFRSADNPDSLRGVALDFVVLDECAFIPNLMQVWTEVLRATLTDRKGRALFISTPNGYDFFSSLMARGRDPKEEDWETFVFPSSTNPYLPPEEVEAARYELPERIFRQEYLAELITDGGQVIRNVDACIYSEARPYGSVVFGVDWGKRDDFTVITVLDVDTCRVVEIDRMNQIDYNLQTQRLVTLASKYNPKVILAESNSMGEPLIEDLKRACLPVEPFTTSNKSKAGVIDALSIAFERGDIAIPNDPVLVNELKSYTVERLATGAFRYSAPPGQHDDCVISLALALEAKDRAGTVIEMW